MAKVLLVEDDNNLREIYAARMQAEGYQVFTAMDGEEALVIAKKELPNLVVADVMMPRISGFEMLDILRNTEGLKRTKIIMLTALGQAEDKTRAQTLGADRYLVKSQVTLEDIVKASKDLLGENHSAPMPNPTPAVAQYGTTHNPSTDAAITNAVNNLAATQNASSANSTPPTAPVSAPKTQTPPQDDPPVAPAAASDPPASSAPTTAPASDSDSVTIAGKKIISPISDPAAAQSSNLQDLLDKEDAQNSVPNNDFQMPTASIPHQPGHVISPQPTSPAPNNSDNS